MLICRPKCFFRNNKEEFGNNIRPEILPKVEKKRPVIGKNKTGGNKGGSDVTTWCYHLMMTTIYLNTLLIKKRLHNLNGLKSSLLTYLLRN